MLKAQLGSKFRHQVISKMFPWSITMAWGSQNLAITWLKRKNAVVLWLLSM